MLGTCAKFRKFEVLIYKILTLKVCVKALVKA